MCELSHYAFCGIDGAGRWMRTHLAAANDPNFPQGLADPSIGAISA
jgi:hypothetical protein